MLVCFLFFLGQLTLAAQQEPEGVLILQEPGSTYTEAMEYHSYHQDNALFATVVTTKGERKKMKAAAVISAVPYPPLSFDPSFADLTQISLEKIGQLEGRYPRVKSQLEKARSKWERALVAFQENRAKPAAVVRAASQSHPTGSDLPKSARLTSATADSVTVTHATGVRTYPLAELTAAQVLALNATSRSVQLPLGIVQPPPVAATLVDASPAESNTTQRIEATGRRVIASLAEVLKITDRTFSVWTFFVVLPALVLVLLVALMLKSRSGRANVRPPRRPTS
ncbi:MAG: hypothetical protein ACR2MW_05290 [Chthoniobacterales bacterium]